MAVRFPEAPRTVELTETNREYIFDHLVTVAKKGYGPGELWYPRGLTISSNTNQIYVVDGGSDLPRVSIFSENGDFVNMFSNERMRHPWGISTHKDNIYVTDVGKHSVFHFKVTEFRFVASVGGLGSGIGQFKQPRQLDVSINGDIYVADFCNARIKVLDSDLHYKRHISHPSMKYPCDVKPTRDEVYVLSYTDSPCVHTFSHDGEKLRCLITRGVIGSQVTNPLFFCLDDEENLIFSDFEGSLVEIFSKKGVLLSNLREQTNGMEDFPAPQGIGMIGNRKLVIVSDNFYNRLKIFYFVKVDCLCY